MAKVESRVGQHAAGVASDEFAAVEHSFGFVGAVASPLGAIADVAVAPCGSRIAVANVVDDSVSIIDTARMKVAAVVPLAGEPTAVVVTEQHVLVGTAAMRTDAVTAIGLDTGTVEQTYPVAFTTTALAAGPDGKRVYAARTTGEQADIAVIDTTAERVGTITVAQGPGITVDALRVDARGRRIYAGVTDARGGRLLVIDAETTRAVGAVHIGAPIRDLALGPDGTAYVLTSDRVRGGSVSVVNLPTNEVRDRIDLGGAPTRLTLSPDGSCAYIVDYDDVAVLCTMTNQVVHSISTGAAPSAVAVSPDGGRLYITDYAGGVSAFSVATTGAMYASFIADAVRVPAAV